MLLFRHVRASRSRRWRLRTRLLAPMVLIVPLVLSIIGVSWEVLVYGQEEGLVVRRQAAALQGIVARLNEQRQSSEKLAYLLTKQPELNRAVETGDTLLLL